MSELTLTPGANVLVRWDENSSNPSGVKSNHLNGKRIKKIVLPDSSHRGLKPKAGETWVCRIERVTNAGSETHGAILVKPLTLEIECVFPGVWVDPEKARLMAITLQNRDKNLMLEGDQGVGKSTIARAVARKLGWQFRKVNGAQIKKFNFMLGRFRPLPKDGQLSFEWVDSKLSRYLREAIKHQEQEFLIMVDEYTRMDEDARDALLEVIEGVERVLTLPTGEDLPVPSNVHFMAAGNVGDGFTIRKQDAAAKDRWVIVKIKHMPQDEELEHCMERYPGCTKQVLHRALAIINHVRSVRNDPKMRLSKTISTRAAQNVAMFLQGGVDIEYALITAVANQFGGDPDDPNSEAGKVAKTIKDELKKLDPSRADAKSS